MASAIDDTKPIQGSATTLSVRAQFTTAKSEISALQVLTATATDTAVGVSELATDAETNTGTATDRVCTPANIAAWTGSTALVTLGTIATGTWQGTAITASYMAAASDTAQGAVELATDAETNTGTATDRAVTPANIEAWTGSAQLTTTGALAGDVTIASGSITSASGAITFGDENLSTTGTLACGALTSTGIDDNCTSEELQIHDGYMTLGSSGAGYIIRNVVNDQFTYLSGGSNFNAGANLLMYGGTYAVGGKAYDILFRSDVTTELHFDYTVNIWDFQDNTIAIGSKTPASAAAAGTAGEVTYDANYIYVCIASGNWVRAAIATW